MQRTARNSPKRHWVGRSRPTIRGDLPQLKETRCPERSAGKANLTRALATLPACGRALRYTAGCCPVVHRRGDDPVRGLLGTSAFLYFLVGENHGNTFRAVSRSLKC